MCLCEPCIQDTSVKLLPSREDSLSPEHQQQRMPHGIIRRFSLDSSDDSTSSASIKHKMVAIDTTQNEHFTHRLLPSQSPEFDNVIDQVLLLISCFTGGFPVSFISIVLLVKSILFVCLFVCCTFSVCFGSDYTHSLTRCLLLGSC